jgi:ketosteroid isomerase-like protein
MSNGVHVIRWSATDIFPDGSPYHNHSVHIIRMRWGKIVEIDAKEDSEAVANMPRKRAEAGVEEATAPQIVS